MKNIILGPFETTFGPRTSKQDFFPKKSLRSIISWYATVTLYKKSEGQFFLELTKPHLAHKTRFPPPPKKTSRSISRLYFRATSRKKSAKFQPFWPKNPRPTSFYSKDWAPSFLKSDDTLISHEKWKNS